MAKQNQTQAEFGTNQARQAKLQLIVSMVIFGTIGIFVRYIPLSSGVIACVRGIVGVLFLLLIVALKKKRISGKAIRKNLIPLGISGVALGANWILLFEAYRYTTVATATLCYYLAPVFVVLASAAVLREKLTAKKILCVLCALTGMVLVSGVAESGVPTFAELRGVLLGTAAAVLYATVVLLNKKITGISANDRTIVQLGITAVILLPYILLTENVAAISLEPVEIVLLIVVGVVHTGVAYALYFNSIRSLRAQTAAMFSYIDPVVAIILSGVLLAEPMGIYGVVGAVLILGSAWVSER